MKEVKEVSQGLSAQKVIWLVAALLFLVFLLRIGSMLGGDTSYFDEAKASEKCDLSKTACVAKFPKGGELSLDLTPKVLPTLTPIHVQVQLTNLPPVKSIRINLKGVDMDMGPNSSLMQAAGDGIYTGQVIIPICTRDEMEWKAEVIVSSESEKRMANFYFWTRS